MRKIKPNTTLYTADKKALSILAQTGIYYRIYFRFTEVISTYNSKFVDDEVGFSRYLHNMTLEQNKDIAYFREKYEDTDILKELEEAWYRLMACGRVIKGATEKYSIMLSELYEVTASLIPLKLSLNTTMKDVVLSASSLLSTLGCICKNPGQGVSERREVIQARNLIEVYSASLNNI